MDSQTRARELEALRKLEQAVTDAIHRGCTMRCISIEEAQQELLTAVYDSVTPI